MKTLHRLTTTAVWLAGTLLGFGEILLSVDRVELANNIDRVYFGRDKITDDEWDAQSFDSGSANVLRRVYLNLFCEENVTPSGTFWVKLYAADGAGGGPGTNMVAAIVEHHPIASLSTNVENQVTFGGLSIPMTPHTQYFVVVGAGESSNGLLWGFTNDPVGANGFPSLFTYSENAGATWRTPFMNALPQRMRVVGIPE